MKLDFFERSRERYLEFANSDESIITIDAGQDLETVTNSIITALEAWLVKNGN